MIWKYLHLEKIYLEETLARKLKLRRKLILLFFSDSFHNFCEALTFSNEGKNNILDKRQSNCLDSIINYSNLLPKRIVLVRKTKLFGNLFYLGNAVDK